MPTRTVAALVAVAVAAPLGAAVLGGCTTAAAPSARPGATVPVALGVLAGQGGTDAVRGAELAVALVNEPHPELHLPLVTGSGLAGLGGAQVRLVVGDTAGDPDAVEAVTDDLLAARVAGIVAAEQAEVVAVASAYATRRGLPMVDAATSAGYLLDLGLDWYFRVTPTDRMLAEPVFALLREAPVPGRRRAVVVTGVGAASGAPDAGGDVEPLLPDLARDARLDLVGEVRVDSAVDPTGGAASARAELAATAPDLVIAVAGTTGQAALLSDVVTGLVPAPVVVGLGPGFRDAPDPPDGTLRPVAWSDGFAGRHPLAAGITALYQARYGRPMSESAATAFTATLALARAVDTAATGDPAAVRVALRQMAVPATQMIMPWVGVRFGGNGQNELATAVVEQAGRDGWRVVFPPELAAGPVEWPARPENAR
jgi:branched-chain amino acid transport system substrate-binding protein